MRKNIRFCTVLALDEHIKASQRPPHEKSYDYHGPMVGEKGGLRRRSSFTAFEMPRKDDSGLFSKGHARHQKKLSIDCLC